MRPLQRHITAVLLLGSYLLASVGTWLHTGREWPCSGVTRCRVSCADHAASWHDRSDGHTAVQPQEVQRSDPSPSHGDHDDQCVICRFLIIKKSADIPPCLVVNSARYLQQVALTLPGYRVADLLTTPDSRAPPTTS